MRHMEFADRIAVVTGGGSGIGRALAVALAARGARVAVTDVDASRLEAVVREVSATGATVRGDLVDATSLAAVEAYRDALLSDWGRVDVLCANVGVGHTAPLAEMTVSDWERVMALNFWSAVYPIQLFAPSMIARRRGRILVTASLAGLVGLPTASAYSASKFALVGLGESLRAELARHGIGVTVLCPGIVRTNFSKDGRFSFGDLPIGGAALDRLWQRVGEDPAAVAERALSALRGGKGVVPSSFAFVTLPWLAKRLGGDLVSTGLGLGLARLAPKAARPAEAPVALRDLRRMSGSELDALYRGAPAPSLEELDGPYDGVLLRWKLAPAMRAVDVIAPGRLPWQGKVFFGGGRRAGANRFAVGRLERHVWRFETKLVDSRFDGGQALAIDYDLPDNPGWLRRGVFDELRKIGGGLYLGKGGVRLGRGSAIEFSWAVTKARAAAA
ncbi:MAG: SDR family oxidoreductase [Deltaproteobacteria bacterium]|nr:SDR family oxidoreductase [Deltaproteobacteria bacterium]